MSRVAIICRTGRKARLDRFRIIANWGGVAETDAFSRIQKSVPLLVTAWSSDEGVTAIDLRDRSVSTHERRVELLASSTGCSASPSRANLRVDKSQL